ncbi:MAG: hypothetical protein M1820_001876 [Bogoriella megaspora]|nr:MAG: hypothetical protein M1820_001876 [Bogoriella megaspora]
MLLLIVPFIAIFCYISYYGLFHPLAKFPGPMLAKLSRLWLAYHAVKGDEAETFLRLHRKYGPVVRISPTLLTVSDARFLPVIYHRNADKTKQDAPMVKTAMDSLFALPDHKAHAQRRKMLSRPASQYSASNVAKLEPFIDTHISHWLSRLSELHASTKSTFDIAPWASYLAFDVISDIAFGAPLGFISAATDVGELIRGLHTGWALFGFLARAYPLKSYLSQSSLLMRKLGLVPNRNAKSGFGILLRTRDKVLKERLAAIASGSPPDRQDLLQAILEARDEEERPLPLGVVKQETLNILIAGAETTGTALQSLLQFLISDSEMYERVTGEIRTASAEGRLSNPSPTPAEVQLHCPLYTACLRETLRLRPPLPGTFPRLVSPPGLALPFANGEHVVPPGFEVTANVLVVGRDKILNGNDADVWRPDRWLEASEEQVREWLRFQFVFGYGARVCLGKDIAMAELLKAGTELLRRFNIHRANGEERWTVRGGVGWWEDLRVKLTPVR